MDSEKLNIDAYSRALAYLLGGVFILSLANATLFDNVLGWLFGSFSLLLIIIAITKWNLGKKYTDKIHSYLAVSLFLVSILRLDMLVISTHKIEFIILGIIFPLLVIFGWGYDMKQKWSQIKSRISSKGRAPIRIPLYVFGSVLLFLALYFRGWGISEYGNSLWYLGSSLVCIGIASRI